MPVSIVNALVEHDDNVSIGAYNKLIERLSAFNKEDPLGVNVQDVRRSYGDISGGDYYMWDSEEEYVARKTELTNDASTPIGILYSEADCIDKFHGRYIETIAGFKGLTDREVDLIRKHAPVVKEWRVHQHFCEKYGNDDYLTFPVRNQTPCFIDAIYQGVKWLFFEYRVNNYSTLPWIKKTPISIIEDRFKGVGGYRDVGGRYAIVVNGVGRTPWNGDLADSDEEMTEVIEVEEVEDEDHR